LYSDVTVLRLCCEYSYNGPVSTVICSLYIYFVFYMRILAIY